MQIAVKSGSLLQHYPIAAYFILTYAVSWLGAFLVAAPHAMRHEAVPKAAGLLMFPVLLLGPCCVGIFLTGATDGRSGLKYLGSRMRRVRFPAQWYAALLIPPILVPAVLLFLRFFVSSNYRPNFFLGGIVFGCLAGFFRRNRLDRLCISKVACPVQWSDCEHFAGIVVGFLALSRYRFSWDRHAARSIPASLFRRVHCRDDGDASPDLLAVCSHGKRMDCSVDARQFHGVSCNLQSDSDYSGAGNVLVCNLRHSLMDDGGDHCCRGRSENFGIANAAPASMKIMGKHSSV